jgi:hypothetical protein
MARKTYKVKDALDRLVEDGWRKDNPFSDDIEVVHKIFFAPFVSYRARAEALSNWLQRTKPLPAAQPCLFGRMAAGRKMHYCFLDDSDLREDDAEIRDQIHQSLVARKRRSVDPQRSAATHGFMLCLLSPRLAYAAPDTNLLNFANTIHDLWGATVEGGFTKETLYLRNPVDGSYVRFTFTVDFFGAQGHMRWWHDHRVPGGLAFTANSAGHMVRHRQWYDGLKKDQIEWLVETAMLTIADAADIGYGPASKLVDLPPHGPVVPGCPFANPATLKPALQGKDWSRYSGWHHSDQCIRSEFFTPSADVPGDMTATWSQDFGYLYDPKNAEHVRFVAGEPCTQEEVDAKLGPRDTWATNYEPTPKRTFRMDSLEAEQKLIEAQQYIEGLLNETRKWVLADSELNEMGGPE